MEEEEWLMCTYPSPMLECLPSPTERKLRLFAVACCRRVWELLPGPGSRRAVDVAERYSDGTATVEELDATSATEEPHSSQDYGGLYIVHPAASRTVNADSCALNTSLLFADSVVPDKDATPDAGKRWEEADGAESAPQAQLLREIFGNPFRPVEVAAAWRTQDVMLLAKGIYEEKAFDRMPILADALQDAGCNVDELLNHLRDAQQAHVRGCWALDLVLGKG
jgi:hypothetical protein